MTEIQKNKLEKIKEHPLVNVIEWKFIEKIFLDNTIYMDTKISYEYFNDPLAKVVYSILGKYISQLGEFKPLLHLEDFCNDELRMDGYKALEYPLEINEPMDICRYVELFDDDTVKVQTLEYYLQNEYHKKALTDVAYEIMDSISDSNVSIKELASKSSFKIDNILYDSDKTVQAKSTHEVVDDMLAYLNSDDLDEYIPTGIDAIDKQSGGTTVPAVICWAANAKVGKSALLIDAIVNNLENGRVCAIYSIEMNIKEVMLRLYARYAGVDFTTIGKKKYSTLEKKVLTEKVLEFRERFKDQFFIYFNPNGVSTKEIETHLTKLQKSGIDVQDIFIDYLQLLESSGNPRAPKVEKMTELPKEVRMLSQKMNLRVNL